MNTYIIPYTEQVFRKLAVAADSLPEAISQFNEQGPVAGVLTFSSPINDSTQLDEEGIVLLNRKKYPEEVVVYQQKDTCVSEVRP